MDSSGVGGPPDGGSDEARAEPDLPRLPGFREIAVRRRRATIDDLTGHRRAAGLSQTDVAARMGTSQSTVARLEAGDVDPRLSTLERYAEAVGGRLEVRFVPEGAPRPWPAGAPDPTDRPGRPGPGTDLPTPSNPSTTPSTPATVPPVLPFRPAAQADPRTAGTPTGPTLPDSHPSRSTRPRR